MLLDPDDQPRSLSLNAARRIERDVSEMLGLVKGVLADGVVSVEEVNLLQQWGAAHPDAIASWPGSIVFQRIERIYADGIVADEERIDLADLLRSLVGGQVGVIAGQGAATELPLDRPAPQIVFANRQFVFTGKFAFGPRSICEEAVRDLGGHCAAGITQLTDYLVIGTFGSRDWVHSSHGRKIEKAVDYRNRNGRLAILGEDHWAVSLP